MTLAHDSDASARFVVSAAPDAGAILEIADGLVGAGHDRLALAEPVDHLEVLVARDAHLDRPERRHALPHDEHALRLLAQLP